VAQQTHFEVRRGVTRIEVQHGFAQAHVLLGAGDLPAKRITVLGALAAAGVSHKYLKLTQDGLAFIFTADGEQEVGRVLGGIGVPFEINNGRSLVLVHAVGMREEPGMIASILEAAIGNGVAIDHVGDMHDKMFIVLASESAESTAEKFRKNLIGGAL
jgi:aspartokinase